MRSGKRSPVFVYLDEFQDVLRLPLALGEALVQARGLGVGLVLAHQHLGQLSPAVRAAVLANAGDRVVFGLDHDDAVVMSKRSSRTLNAERLHWLTRF
ncbi:MAG: TraM recognition domain-containing protein [Candidatus Microthrix sp.]|uniref:TraM recognition domain-containing protein n=1 Tax=Candidatus Neomicrothrix sp. TaxID=2719034 RepID=UPI0025C72B6E|nr:TraM recognition domain-containing protein [Candidatus Microthrix sp.]MBL0204905.1 TraM recognition domain-containing protein [Candidatus Microthrix sp.]